MLKHLYRNAMLAVVFLVVHLPLPSSGAEAGPIADPGLRAAVESDWIAQEARRKRSPHDLAAVREAYSRADALLQSLTSVSGKESLQTDADSLARLRRQLDRIDQRDEAARRSLYCEIRWTIRNLMLKNPLFPGQPIAFVKRHRFIDQMLHEYVGYYYNYGDLAGGGIFALEEPGRSLRTRNLVPTGLPRGTYTTPAVSFDGKVVYFAFSEVREEPRNYSAGTHWQKLLPAARVPEPFNYYSAQRPVFHVFSVGSDGRGLRRLSEGPDDDFCPCPLPDGCLLFLSARRGGFCRCDGDFEPIPTYTLHRMDADGGNVRTLSFHETNEWHPSMLNDGRVVYSRWDYVDRSAAHFHGLWAANPDGSNPRVLVGSYTKRISACFQPRAIPGSNRIVFVAGAHHADVGGSLVLFDPTRAKLDPSSGQDLFDSFEVLTPEVCFPEAPHWPKSYYSSPWPLSEDFYLVAFSFDPLPGMGSRVTKDTETGLYYFDRFGNLELLYREAGIGCSDPIPLAPRPSPPIIADSHDPSLGEEGEFVLTNVNWSLLPLPASRTVRELRVFQILPKTTHTADDPPIGHALEASARTLLGTVPVESDGSAYFRAPAGKLLYFQAVDASGRAVAGMRSVTYLQSGERRGCVGCHEPQHTSPASRPALATLRRPSKIEPGPDGTRPIGYARLIQPILDRHCVRCHDGKDGTRKSKVALTGEPAGRFTRSYQSLEQYVRYYSWLGKGVNDIVTRPGTLGADSSALTRTLDDADHATEVKLSDADRRAIYLWLDANALFYGTYDYKEQQAQREGKSIPLPTLQ